MVLVIVAIVALNIGDSSQKPDWLGDILKGFNEFLTGGKKTTQAPVTVTTSGSQTRAGDQSSAANDIEALAEQTNSASGSQTTAGSGTQTTAGSGSQTTVAVAGDQTKAAAAGSQTTTAAAGGQTTAAAAGGQTTAA
ncbi:hypothetical protein C0J52_12469, partial [Blattella germanica]